MTNYIRNLFMLLCVLTVLVIFGSSTAMAQASFDYTPYSTTLSTGAGVVATTATLLAGILAGVLVWRKIAKYFNKAG